MIKLHIIVIKSETNVKQKLDLDVLVDSINESIFESGNEEELERQKPFISSLIWGCIGFNVNNSIQRKEVKCSIEFENGHTIDIPRDVIFNIQQILV